jgi:threo-3-hydroxy-L-aspartate ammonia-lyase
MVTVAVTTEFVPLEAIRAAAADLAGVAVRTPLLPADALSDQLDTPVYVKPESLQRVGAFKIRGAWTLVRRLAREGATGVVTYSSGNHGQAVAYAARRLGLRAVVVMPETVSEAKRRGVERLGGEVVIAGRTSADRYDRARALSAEQGLAMAPPFDHESIIAGQGTVGLEIVEDCPDVGVVCVPVGGGGLSSGVATAVKALRPAAEVVTVEPEGAPKFFTSRAKGERVVLERTASIADGLITLSVGVLNYRHLVRFTDRSVLVSDAAIREAVRYAVDRLKLVLEPSGAATLAWLLAQPSGALRGPVVAVLSGGNVEWEGLAHLLGGPA